MKCLFCLSGQCVHTGHHDDNPGNLHLIPDAITIHGGESYCAACISGYIQMTRKRVRDGELTGMRPSS